MYINGTTIKDVWVKAINMILKTGETNIDERGSEVLEINNLFANIDLDDNVFIENPCYDIPKGSHWKPDKLKVYQEQFLNPDNEKNFVYTYGQRLRGYEMAIPLKNKFYKAKKIDQIQEVINKLNNNINTRRAVAVTFNPYLDNENDEIPCLMMVKFEVKNNKLKTFAVWRSHDIYGAWFANLIGLWKLADYVKDNVKKCIGLDDIIVLSMNAHIYKNDVMDAQKIIDSN